MKIARDGLFITLFVSASLLIFLIGMIIPCGMIISEFSERNGYNMEIANILSDINDTFGLHNNDIASVESVLIVRSSDYLPVKCEYNNISTKYIENLYGYIIKFNNGAEEMERDIAQNWILTCDMKQGEVDRLDEMTGGISFIPDISNGYWSVNTIHGKHIVAYGMYDMDSHVLYFAYF